MCVHVQKRVHSEAELKEALIRAAMRASDAAQADQPPTATDLDDDDGRMAAEDVEGLGKLLPVGGHLAMGATERQGQHRAAGS